MAKPRLTGFNHRYVTGGDPAWGVSEKEESMPTYSPELRRAIETFAGNLHCAISYHGQIPEDVRESLPRKSLGWTLSFDTQGFLFKDGDEGDLRAFSEVPDTMMPYVLCGLETMFFRGTGKQVREHFEGYPYEEQAARALLDKLEQDLAALLATRMEFLALCSTVSEHLVERSIAPRAAWCDVRIRREACCSSVEFAMPQAERTTWKLPEDLRFHELQSASNVLVIPAQALVSPDNQLLPALMDIGENLAAIRRELSNLEPVSKKADIRTAILSGAQEIFDQLCRGGYDFSYEIVDTGNARATITATGDGFTIKPHHESRWLALADADDGFLFAATKNLRGIVEEATWGTRQSRAASSPTTPGEASSRMEEALSNLRSFVKLRADAVKLAGLIVAFAKMKRFGEESTVSGIQGRILFDPTASESDMIQIQSGHGSYAPKDMLLRGTQKAAHLLAQLAFRVSKASELTSDVLSLSAVSGAVQKALAHLEAEIRAFGQVNQFIQVGSENTQRGVAAADQNKVAFETLVDTWVKSAIELKLPAASVNVAEGFVLIWEPNCLKLASGEESGPLLSFPSGPLRLAACRALTTLTQTALAELEEARKLELLEIQAVSDAVSLLTKKD